MYPHISKHKYSFNACNSVWVFEIPSLLIWQNVCMHIRPLISRKVHLESLPDAPPRTTKLLLKIKPYDFEIKYIPGK